MIAKLRNTDPTILVVGNHQKIVQSILDFDYASGREKPSVLGIVSSGRKSQKFFWGDTECLVPVFDSLESVKEIGVEPNFLLCITSAGSTPKITLRFFELFPSSQGAHLFAEGVTERDALFLVEHLGDAKLIVGPSGVGLCIPGTLKLGAIGGISGPCVAELGSQSGHVAVICSSGGMINEIMYQVTAAGSGISFAACYGGDHFPATSPLQWLQAAQDDPQTKAIVYFGELGGADEYVLRDAIKDKRISKPVYAYIAGHYQLGDTKIQFGHAKALARAESETAQAKMTALQAVGVNVAENFEDFMVMLQSLDKRISVVPHARSWQQRPFHVKPTLFSASSYHNTTAGSFTEAILLRLLQKERVTRETVDFTQKIFIELIDHGPQVSGAVTTMITARAGRDIATSLATGLLTIGDRFGGAVNAAASTWLQGVSRGTTATELVAQSSNARTHIAGIGHRKYSVYKPDPRVEELIAHARTVLRETEFLDLALAVSELTTQKRSNLILNVDGAMSALFMDYLREKEGYTYKDLRILVENQFFNALFIIPRTVGFIGNFLEQKKIDEGLFRLGDSDFLDLRS